MASTLIESLKRLYPARVTKEKLQAMVEKGQITEEEYAEIIRE